MRDAQGQISESYLATSVEDLARIAKSIIRYAERFPIILLIGEMGTGKTTLSKAIMAQLGLAETSSPTFSLVNRYDTASGVWYHFDLYRIEDEEELFDLGFEEYLDSGAPCLIEWPQIASSFIQAPYLKVSLELEGEARRITLGPVST